MSPNNQLVALVERWNSGDRDALDSLVELLYDDLRGLAHRHLATERQGHTLNTTALVNEVYLELSRRSGVEWFGRPQLMALTSRVMRNVLIDHARRRSADKRGGDQVFVPLDQAEPALDGELFELLMVDQAIKHLKAQDEQLAKIVECRFFGGMTETDIAQALGISTRTVRRGWSLARAYLHRLLTNNEPQLATEDE